MLPPDVNAPPRSRRRYAQGNTRSKTIELGTLSELDEDIYHNKEAVCQTATGSQDDSAVNTMRWPRNGTVKSIARHLSERQKAEQGKLPYPYLSFIEHIFEVRSKPVPHGENLHHQPCCKNNVERTMSFSQQSLDCAKRRKVQYMPEAIERCNDPRTQFTQWNQQHYFDEHDHLPSMSEFHASTASSLARTQSTMPCQSTSKTGTMLVSNPRAMSLIDSRPSNLYVSSCPMPVWYAPHTPFQPPPPMYIPIGHPALPLQSKFYPERKKPSVCAEMCCGGVAQMLWTLICVVLLGIVGVLITALFYV